MTNKKSTKRALANSVVALFLCFTMLLGTTFAWFTDSAASANNIIKSGTLDVTMEWTDGKNDPASTETTWTDASTGTIFNNDKWEPGYTEVRHIKISNVGTLALKYQLDIAANGDVSDLADVIDVYFIDPAQQVTDRTTLDDIEPVGTLTQILAGMPANASGDLLAGQTDTVTLALKMSESAGNEYQNKEIGSDFTIQLLATQLPHEADSFGTDYDEDATYPEDIEVSNVDELLEVVGTGQTAIIAKDATITLGEDAEIENPVTGQAAIVNNGTLNITGGDYANGDTTESSSAVIENRGVLNISGGEFGTDGNSGRAVSNIGGTVTITGGTFSAFDRNEHTSLAAYVFTTSGGTITIDNATSIGAPNGIFYATNGGEIIVNGGSFTKGKAANNYYLAYANGGTIKLNGGTYVFENSDECIWPFYDSIDGLKYNTTTQIYLDESCTVNWDRNK